MVILNVIITVFVYIYLICSGVILAAIMAAILDLEVTCILKFIFDVIIGSGMVKNIYIDTNIVTLSAIFMELCPF